MKVFLAMVIVIALITVPIALLFMGIHFIKMRKTIPAIIYMTTGIIDFIIFYILFF